MLIYFLKICSTIFWFKYGFILGDVPISLVNGFGLVLALYSALIYHHHTNHRTSCQAFSIIALSGVLFWLMAISAGWIKLDGVGFSAMTASVCMFAAPLTAIYEILKQHFSAEIPSSPKPRLLKRNRTSLWVPREGISLAMILVSVAVSGSWFAYGLVIRDKFVAIPNGLGLIMCLIQYGVWSISYPSAISAFETSGVANSNNSSCSESKNTLIHFFKHQPENQDPLILNPNSIVPAIEMKNF